MHKGVIRIQKTVIGTREIIEYKGTCPDCKKEQKSFFETEVDVPCWDCSKKRKEEKIKHQYKHLIGGTIIDVYGYNNLTMIKIKALDGHEYDVSPHREFGNTDFESYLKVDEIEPETSNMQNEWNRIREGSYTGSQLRERFMTYHLRKSGKQPSLFEY